MHDDANLELHSPAQAKYARDHVRQYKKLIISAPKKLIDGYNQKREIKRRQAVKAHA